MQPFIVLLILEEGGGWGLVELVQTGQKTTCLGVNDPQDN